MLHPTECPKCHGSMSEGAMVDTGHGSYSVSSWQPGEPSVSRWFGLKVKPKTFLPTTAYRCSRCGFLEIYAPAVKS